jgi:hypothetical protein
MKEVTEIVNNGKGDATIQLDVNILAGKTWIKPIRIEQTNVLRQYADSQYGDMRFVEISVTRGTYVFDLLANRDNLQLDMTETYLQPGTAIPVPDLPSFTRRYRAILGNIDDATIAGKHSQMQTREAMDQASGLTYVTIQLIDECVYRAMMIQGGDNYRQMTGMDIVVAELTKLIGAMGTKNSARILGLDIVPGFNQTVKLQMPIPHGTPFKDIPFLVHEKGGGLYATGCGRYIQDQILYIYPLYDTERYRKNARTLSVINVPNDRYGGGEKTYKVDAMNVTVLCTGSASLNDPSLGDSLTKGNATRFLDSNRILTDFGLVKDGKMLIDRATNVAEFVTEKLASGVNNFRWGEKRATSNPFKEYSDLARKKGQMLTIEWTHGDSNLLYPGMPVKYQTVSNDSVETYYGVLLGVEEWRFAANPGATANRWASKVRLGVFINRHVVNEIANPAP